jgi:WD40 repeat protein
MERIYFALRFIVLLVVIGACTSPSSSSGPLPPSPTPIPPVATSPACEPLPGKCPAWSPAAPTSAGRITAANVNKLSALAELNDFPVYAISWPADSKRIALTGPAGIVVYAVDPWQLLLAIDMKGYPTFGLALSPDGKTLAYSPGHNPLENVEQVVHLVDVASRRERTALQGHEKTIWHIAFSADGSRLATNSDDYQIWIWDLQSGAVVKKFTDQPAQAALTFSPDGKSLLVQPLTGLPFVLDLQGKASPWIVGEKPNDFGMHSFSSAFSPDGRTILVGSDDHQIHRWDVARRKEVGAWVAHDDTVDGLAFAPDGQLFVSVSRDGTVKLWDTATNKLITTLTWKNSSKLMTASNVMFSPDGRYLVAGIGSNPMLRVWGIEP